MSVKYVMIIAKNVGEEGNCLNCIDGWFAEKQGNVKKC